MVHPDNVTEEDSDAQVSPPASAKSIDFAHGAWQDSRKSRITETVLAVPLRP